MALIGKKGGQKFYKHIPQCGSAGTASAPFKRKGTAPYEVCAAIAQ
jgi:hypothetical protein